MIFAGDVKLHHPLFFAVQGPKLFRYWVTIQSTLYNYVQRNPNHLTVDMVLFEGEIDGFWSITEGHCMIPASIARSRTRRHWTNRTSGTCTRTVCTEDSVVIRYLSIPGAQSSLIVWQGRTRNFPTGKHAGSTRSRGFRYFLRQVIWLLHRVQKRERTVRT